MKKRGLKRAFAGAVCGIAMDHILMLMISYTDYHGVYHAVSEEFALRFANEITAVLIQLLLFAGLGVVFALSSFLFEFDRISFVMQLFLHFLITATIWWTLILLIWTKPGTMLSQVFAEKKNVRMVIVFLLTYLINWLIQYYVNVKDVEKINAKLKLGEKEKHIL